MKHKLSALVLSLGLLVPALGHAQELGSKGDAVFSAERVMGITGTHRVRENEPNDEERDWTAFGFGWRANPDSSPYDVARLAFDYLVIDHLSIGGSLGYASIKLDDPDFDAALFEFSPRIGYLYSFGRVVAIWPRGGFTYHSLSVDNGDKETGFGLNVECMFTFSPAQHFAFVLGPTFDLDMFGERDPNGPGPDVDQRYRSWGLNAGLLGWF